MDIVTIFTSKVTVNGWKGMMRKGHDVEKKTTTVRVAPHSEYRVKVESTIIPTIRQPSVGPVGTGGGRKSGEKSNRIITGGEIATMRFEPTDRPF